LQNASNDVLNIAITANTTAGDVDVSGTGVTATNIETIAITNNYNSAMTAANKTTALAATQAAAITILSNQPTTITVTGDASLDLTAASTLLTSMDASGITVGATGVFSWTAGVLTAAATVKGAASAINNINLASATEKVTYTGSSGNDSIVLATADKANVLTLGNGTNAVTGVSVGDNTITGGTGNDTFNTGTTGDNTISFGDGTNSFIATTGANTYTGGSGADTVTVTSGKNTITTGGGNDVVTVGGAVNTIDVGTGTDSVTINALTAAGTLYSTITGIGVGDTIKIDTATAANGTPTFVTAKIADLGSNAVFSDYLDAASTGDGSTNSVMQWFQTGGNTYIVTDNAAAATFSDGVDSVVELAGTVTINGFTGAATSATFLLA
jgi:S-layer protein